MPRHGKGEANSMSDSAVEQDRRNAAHKGNTAGQTLPVILLAAVTCGQAVFLLHTVLPQRIAFQNIGLYEAMFVASEITILAFEVFYLFLFVYGILRQTAAPRTDRAKGITFLFFALLLVVQTVFNTFFTALDGGILRFLAAKNLCTLALVTGIELIRHRKGGVAHRPDGDKTAAKTADGMTDATAAPAKAKVAGTALLIFLFFYSVYVFFSFYADYPFMTPVGYAHLSLCLICTVFFIVCAPERKGRPLAKLMRGLRVLLLAMTVLLSAVILPMIFSQHHRVLTADCTTDELDAVLLNAETSSSDVIVCENEDVYIYFPLYEDIRFAAGDLPSKADEQTIMVIPAAFTHAYALDFSHDNIEGLHADAGTLYEGGTLAEAGAFTYADGQAALWNADEAEAALQEAARQDGCGYQQYLMLEDGERTDFTMGPLTCYRALAEWKGRICVIDSKQRMLYPEFLTLLEALGVENAIYCDMGTGWNYSWYRENDGDAKNLFGIPWPFSTCWLVFRK